jgi:fumarate reductase subunit C
MQDIHNFEHRVVEALNKIPNGANEFAEFLKNLVLVVLPASLISTLYKSYPLYGSHFGSSVKFFVDCTQQDTKWGKRLQRR